MPPAPRRSAPLRLVLAAFAVATLALLLAAAWLRFLVPVRQRVHVRDLGWRPSLPRARQP